MTSPGTCQACQHEQERHSPEVPGCIECRCAAFVSAESVTDEMRDRVELRFLQARPCDNCSGDPDTCDCDES